jgi:ABC-2 type transport system permease protein
LGGIGLSGAVELLIAYVVSIVPIIPVILFAVVVSQLCKNSSSTVMLTIFGYMIAIAVGIVFPRFHSMLFTSYTIWYKLFIGAAMPFASILNDLILLIAYALILFSAGSWMFEKKEY